MKWKGLNSSIMTNVTWTQTLHAWSCFRQKIIWPWKIITRQRNMKKTWRSLYVENQENRTIAILLYRILEFQNVTSFRRVEPPCFPEVYFFLLLRFLDQCTCHFTLLSSNLFSAWKLACSSKQETCTWRLFWVKMRQFECLCISDRSDTRFTRPD